MKYSENKPKRRNEIGESLLEMKLEPVFSKLLKSPCTLSEKSALDFRHSKNMHAVQGLHFNGCQQNTYYQDQSFSKYKSLAFILGFILITSSFPVAECLPRPQIQVEQISPILSSTTRTLLPNNMNPSSSFQFYMTMNPTPIQMEKSSTNRNTGIYPAQSIMVLTNEGATQRFSQTADPHIISSLSPQMLTTQFGGFRTETKTVEETKRISPYDDNIYQDFEGKHPGLNKTEDLLSQSHLQIPSTTNPNQLIAPQTVSTSASVTPDPGSRADLSMLNPDVSHLEHNKNKNLTGHQNKLQAHKATDSPALSEYLKNKYHQKHSNHTGKGMERNNNKKLLDQYLPIPLTNMLVKLNEDEGLTKYVQINTEYPLLRQADTDTPPTTETKNKKIKEINTKKSHAIDGLPLVKDRLPPLPQYNKFVRNRAFYSSRAETARERRQKDSNTSTSIIEDKTKNSDSARLVENPHVNSKQSVQSSFPHSPASPTSRSTYLNLFARLPLLFPTEIGNETEKANTGTNNENTEGHNKKDSSIAVSTSSTPVNIGVLSDDSDSASNVAHKTVGEDFITVVKKDQNPQVMKKPILLPVTDIADTGRITQAEMENNRNHMILPKVQFQPQENGYNHNSTTSKALLITKARINAESLPGLLEKLPETDDESTSTETKPELVLIVTEEDSQLLRKPKLPLQAIDSTSSGSGSVATTTDDAVVSIIHENQNQDDNNHEIKENFTFKSEAQSPALEQDININQNKKLTSPLLLHQVFQVQPQENENREMSESLLALTETPSSGLEIESSEAEAVILTTPPTTPAPVPIFHEIKFQSFPFLISPPFVTIDGSFMGGKVPPLSLLDELGPVL